VNVIGDPRKMDIIEASRRFIGDHDIEISADNVDGGCGSNLGLDGYMKKRFRLEKCKCSRTTNGSGRDPRFEQYQFAGGTTPRSRAIHLPPRNVLRTIQTGFENHLLL
jgi:hypothetical protein